jgi:hypothetical protein
MTETPNDVPQGVTGVIAQTLPAFTQQMRGVVPIHVLRELLIWSIATRRELDRWEAHVAEITLLGFAKEKLSGRLNWETSTERHFTFVAARNMVRALNLVAPDLVDQHVKDTLRAVRNVLEHWDDYMPIFNVTPRASIPRKGFSAGTWFSEHHEGSPFSAWAWNSSTGPKLLQKFPASDLRAALDAVDRWVLEQDPVFAEYIPPVVPSPWFGPEAGRDQWWPKPHP